MPGLLEDFEPREVERAMLDGFDEREDRRFFGETFDESAARMRQPIFPITGQDISSFVAGVDQAAPSMGANLGSFILSVQDHFGMQPEPEEGQPSPEPGEADDTDPPPPEPGFVAGAIDRMAGSLNPPVRQTGRFLRGAGQVLSPGSFPETTRPDAVVEGQPSPQAAGIGRELGIWAPLAVLGGGVGLAGTRALGQAIIGTPRLGAMYLRMATVFDIMGAGVGAAAGDTVTGAVFANPDDPSLVVILAGMESDNPQWEAVREGIVDSLLADEDADAFERRIANGVQEGMATLFGEAAGFGVLRGGPAAARATLRGLRHFYRAIRNGVKEVPTGGGGQLPPTIDIDGADRPTRSSRGLPIAQSEPEAREFWQWFGDSPVVDDAGRPLAMFHGTVEEFSGFREGFNAGGISRGRDFYFTDSTEAANSFADPFIPADRVMNRLDQEQDAAFRDSIREGVTETEEREARARMAEIRTRQDARSAEIRREGGRSGANVIPVFAAPRNPLIVDAEGRSFLNIRGGNNNQGVIDNPAFNGDEMTFGPGPNGERRFMPDPRGKVPNVNMNEIVSEARAAGHDGVIVRNVMDAGTGEVMDAQRAAGRGVTVVAVFDADLIRSATAGEIMSPSVARLRRVEDEGRARFNLTGEGSPEEADMARSMVGAGRIADFIEEVRRRMGGDNAGR